MFINFSLPFKIPFCKLFPGLPCSMMRGFSCFTGILFYKQNYIYRGLDRCASVSGLGVVLKSLPLRLFVQIGRLVLVFASGIKTLELKSSGHRTLEGWGPLFQVLSIQSKWFSSVSAYMGEKWNKMLLFENTFLAPPNQYLLLFVALLSCG